MKGGFWHRLNPKKDFTNGLVGQAWTIEALMALGEHFDYKDSYALCEEVFLLHQYDNRFSAWKRVNVDGSYLSFDTTFNHQLWFAASGAIIANRTNNDAISGQLDHFLNSMDNIFHVYSDGLVKHKAPGYFATGVISHLRNYRAIAKSMSLKKLRMKSVGYHGFNLYAFAILKHYLPEHPCWNSPKIKKALEYAMGSKYKKELVGNMYGFPYNPPGIEISYAFQEFGIDDGSLIHDWLKWHFKECFDYDQDLMLLGNTKDRNTSAARLYEATRLLDCNF
jgi:hypothetical protein